MRFKQSPLSLTIKLLLGGATLGASQMAMAQAATSAQESESRVTVIQVTAVGIDESATKIVAPYTLVDKDEIFERGGTLGDLLNGLPGVHSDNFGGGSSRPVIRGQTSPRVRVLSDSATLFDASDVSPDHAVVADPLLAQRIEVLRGPATLLYGGGAVGGIVNVLDNKIPTAMPENRVSGDVALRANTVAEEKAGAVGVTAQATDNLALRFEGSLRDTHDYKAPGFDHVDGTFSESTNLTFGTSWIGEKGFLGLAYSYREDEYGIPGHDEEYADCHVHGSILDCDGHDSDHGHDSHGGHGHDHDLPFVDLRSERLDLRGEIDDPFAGVHRIRIRGSHTNYRHYEVEEDEISTTFRNKGYEGRVELDHVPIMGWHGVVGTQFSNTSFSSIGAEAFIPETDSRMGGLFAVEHYDFNDEWHLEAGIRYEHQRHRTNNDPRNRPDFSSTALSWSGSVIWTMTDEHTMALTYSRAQRLPHAQELYARGVHLATNTFECGMMPHPTTCGGLANNQDINKETSNNVDLAFRKHSGNLTYSVNLFRNEVDNYIFARTLDQYEDFRLIKYTQRDATFRGAEVEVGYEFNEMFSATVFGDYVRARLETGENLPRISPKRAGARLNMVTGSVFSQLEYFRVSTQNQFADFETATPGYNMLNLTANFHPFNDERYTVFVRGTNLLNDEVFVHTSFLARVIPMPGRNFSAGFRYSF